MAKLFTYSLLAAAMCLSANASAQDVELFSFAVDPAANGKTISLNISAEGGQQLKVDWGNGTLQNYEVVNYDDAGWVFSEVAGTIVGETVKVYGTDASKINYLSADLTLADAPEAKLISIDVSKLTGVKELDVSKNNIVTLDISNCASLTKLTANDNQLTKLTLAQNENLTTVNVSNNFNTATGSLNADAGNNQVLASKWNLLPNLSSLNVSANTKLGFLGKFDISQNTKLGTLNINGCGFSSLDFTVFTSLKTLNAQWNKFTAADLSKMVAKGATVFLNHNNLKSIKLPDTSSAKMTRVNVADNALTFETLPPAGMTSNANNYVYAPQTDIVAPITADNIVDLKSQAKVGDTPSVFTWTAILDDATGPVALTDAQYEFSEADGTFKFLVPVKDLRASITNEALPKLTLKSTPATSVSLLPLMVSMDMASEAGTDFQFGLNSTLSQVVYVDWGDGVFDGPISVEQLSYDYAPDYITGKTKGKTVKIKGEPSSIEAFIAPAETSFVSGTGVVTTAQIEKIDLSNLTAIKKLDLDNHAISTLDLSKNVELVSVRAISNKLTAFDVSLPALTTLDLSNSGSNGVKILGENAPEIAFDKLPALTNLTANYTGIKPDLSKAARLNGVILLGNGYTDYAPVSGTVTQITLNFNNYETFDGTGLTATGKVNVFLTNNKLGATADCIKLPAHANNVNISNNRFTFATLPAVNSVGGTLTYALQAAMPAEVKDKVTVDLSSQVRVGDVATVYKWELDGKEVTSGITANEGVFTFSEGGDYVCKMTNTEFPRLTLSTETVTIDAPKKLFSFTVAPEAVGKTMVLNISSTDNQSVQVDWGNAALSDPVVTKNYADTWEYGTPTGVVAGTDIIVYGGNPATINKLDLSWDKNAGVETKMLTIDLSRLTGVDDVTVSSNALTSLDLTNNTALAKLFINGNNITDIKFADDCAVTRIDAQNTADAGENNLFKVDLSKAEKLNYLNINFNNKNAEAATIDLGKNVELATIMATDCNLETIDVSKLSKLGQLTVNNNNLTTVDVSQMTDRGCLFAINNKISSLVLPEKLDRLNVSNNKLTFATLPAATIANTYVYNNQKPMPVEAEEGKIDLSSQAKVGDVETVFAWTADSEDFKDYTVAAGVFTFTKSAQNAVCTMTNTMLLNLTLTTIPVNVEASTSAITEIEGENAGEDAVYYNLQGVKVSGTEPGVYIRRQGNRITKVIVK